MRAGTSLKHIEDGRKEKGDTGHPLRGGGRGDSINGDEQEGNSPGLQAW